MGLIHRAIAIVSTSFFCFASGAAAATQPVRAADSAQAAAQQQPAPPRAPRPKPRPPTGGVSPQVLAAVGLGLGGLVVAAAATGGRSNASPR